MRAQNVISKKLADFSIFWNWSRSNLSLLSFPPDFKSKLILIGQKPYLHRSDWYFCSQQTDENLFGRPTSLIIEHLTFSRHFENCMFWEFGKRKNDNWGVNYRHHHVDVSHGSVRSLKASSSSYFISVKHNSRTRALEWGWKSALP